MKVTVEKVTNGFVMEKDVYHYRPGSEPYTMVVSSVSVERSICPTLKDVFDELTSLFPVETSGEQK